LVVLIVGTPHLLATISYNCSELGADDWPIYSRRAA
jgi:hypothetical protein